MFVDGYVEATIAFFVLQWVFSLGRVIVRTVLVKAFGKDDVAALVTLLLASAYMSLLMAIAQLSDLRPLSEVNPSEIIPSVNLVLAAECAYILATASLKVSLGLLLLRVLVRRWMVWTIYALMAVSVSFGLAFFFFVLFQCGNPQHFVVEIVKGQCLAYDTINGLSYGHAILTAGADIIYGILPVAFLWNADFAKRTKISVGAILLLGSVGCVCTLIRIGWIHYLTAATNRYLVTSRGIALMSTIELSLGLTCLSLATYKPIINHFFPRQSYYYYSEHSMVRTSQHEHGDPEAMAIVPVREALHSRGSTKWSQYSPQTTSVENLGEISRQSSANSGKAPTTIEAAHLGRAI